MWPWDHLAIGYLCLSLWRRYRSGRAPTSGEAVAVLLGSQLPDLIDKPLGWGTTLLPSGTSLGHSLLVAVPVSLAVYLVARYFDRGAVGAAFAIGYLLHLPADVVYPIFVGQGVAWRFLLWPLVPLPPSQPVAIADYALALFVSFLEFLRTPQGVAFVLGEVTLLMATLLTWRRDGWPGIRRVRGALGA